MKKASKFIFLLLSLAVMFVVFSTLKRTDVAHAAVRNDFVKKLTLTDSNGKEFTPDPTNGFGSLKLYESFRVNVDFEVANDAKEGDTIQFKLPDTPALLQFENTKDFTITDEKHPTEVVANGRFDRTNRTLTLTMTKYVEQHSDIKGDFFFYLKIDDKVVNTKQVVPITIEVNGQVAAIPNNQINFDPSPTPVVSKLAKTGWRVINPDNSITFRYRVSINREKTEFKDTVVHDFYKTPGILYKQGTFVIEKGTWDKDAQGQWLLTNTTDVTNQFTFKTGSSAPGLHEFVVSDDLRSFAVNFGDITANEGYQIVYDAELAPGVTMYDGQTYSNVARMTASNTTINHWENTDIYRESGGKASGFNYILKVKKTTEDGVTPLSGAKFEVRHKGTGQVVKNSDGEPQCH